MPDSSGALTAADNEKIQGWWARHWKAPVICPVCKNNEWSIAGHVVSITRHASDGMIGGTQNYPHIMVLCTTCAHTMFFNAVSIGVSATYVRPTTALSTNLTAPSAVNDLFGSLAPPFTTTTSLTDLFKKK